MEKEKQSILNDEFDLGLAILIIRKNLIWIFLFLIIGASTAFFINRYSLPVFESSSILKIGDKNEMNRVMKFDNIYETNLSGELSRLKSKKMLNAATNNLDLDVSYYSKGKLIDSENYTSNPFKIKYQIKDNSAYNIQYEITFIDKVAKLISIKNDQTKVQLIPVNTWSSINEIEIFIEVSNAKLNEINNKVFKFKISERNQILNRINENINISIENPRAKTIKISYRDNHPSKAANIINSLSNEFLRSNILKKKESANQMIAFTNEQINQINQKLNYYQTLLSPYQKSTSTVDFSPKEITESLKVKDQLEEFQLEKTLNVLQKFKFLLDKGSRNEEIYSILILNAENKYLSSVGNRLRDLLNNRRTLIFRVTEESFEVKEIDYQINLEKEDLKEIISNLIKDIQENIIAVKERLGSYAKSKATTTENYDFNTDFQHLNRMYELNSDYYGKLLSKKAEYEMVRVGFVSDNEVIEPARINSVPISPRKQLTYLIFIGIGGIIGLGIVVIKYLLHNTLSNTADINKYTSTIPILGMVPSYKDVIPVSQLIVDKNPKSLMSEAFRSIRSNLQFISNNEGSKVLTVTSTISGEGKTFVAINLGGIIAFSEKKVIILDLDMRKPKTHIGFNVQNTVGMSTLLIGKTTIDECVQKSNLENLHFITAGPIPPNPSELIISNAMTKIIDDLKKLYDVIVIDTPPVGIVTDALPIISKVDYPIYIVRAHFSKKAFLRNIQMLKDEKNVKNLSIILNGSGGGKGYGGYGSKYGYGYGAGGYGYGYGYGGDHGYYEEKPQVERKSSKNIFKRE